MNYLSLFSGIGGLDLDLDRAGMTCVGQVELDPFCRRILAAHWPEVPRHDDIRTAPRWWLATDRPRVDLICGGFPCQPVSQAGAKLAQEDPRWLWPHMVAVAAATRPGWIIAENVPGLLRRGFGDVLRDLAALGFDAEWDCVPAASVGAPHIRDRVFIVARFREPQGRVSDAHGGDLRVERERDRQQHGQPGAAIATQHGAPQPVADPDREGLGGLPVASAGRDNVRPIRPVRADPDRCGPDVPAPAGVDRREGTGRPHGRTQDGPGIAAAGLANAESLGRDVRPVEWAHHGAESRRRDPGELADAGLAGPQGPRLFRAAPDRAHWPAEPRIRRVANGVPAGVDRLRSLGNAVVPQVAEHVGRLVMAAAA